MKKLAIIIQNPWVEFVARVSLGILFIYAAIPKMINPGDFAKIIYGYKLFHSDLINLFAITLPFIEFLCGLALIIGLWPRSNAIIINALLLSFIVAISINLIRGHEFDCGCFAVNSYSKNSSFWLLIRDIFWFVAGVIIIYFNGERKYVIRPFFK